MCRPVLALVRLKSFQRPHFHPTPTHLIWSRIESVVIWEVQEATGSLQVLRLQESRTEKVYLLKQCSSQFIFSSLDDNGWAEKTATNWVDRQRNWRDGRENFGWLGNLEAKVYSTVCNQELDVVVALLVLHNPGNYRQRTNPIDDLNYRETVQFEYFDNRKNHAVLWFRLCSVLHSRLLLRGPTFEATCTCYWSSADGYRQLHVFYSAFDCRFVYKHLQRRWGWFEQSELNLSNAFKSTYF